MFLKLISGTIPKIKSTLCLKIGWHVYNNRILSCINKNSLSSVLKYNLTLSSE